MARLAPVSRRPRRWPSVGMLCAVAGAVATLPATGAAATLVVSATADNGPGTCLPGACTLRDALANVKAGDAILVPAGRYVATKTAGNGVFPADGSGWSLQGAGAGQTIIDGGGLGRTFAFYAQATFTGVTVTGGVAPNAGCACGGAFEVRQGGALTLVSSVVEENSAPSGGGGIDVDTASRATLRDVVVRRNSTPGAGGGGIRVEPATGSGGRLTMTNVTIAGNTTAKGVNGGGLLNQGTTRGTNVTFSGNAASGGGGAVANTGAGTLALDNATLAANTALGAGPGILNNATTGAVTLRNSIVADAAGGDCAGTASPLVTSLGHNLALSAGCGLTGPGDLPGTDPQLGPLTSAGVLPVHVPALTSPALDKGDNAACPSTDALGAPRPFGAVCDIGAVEVQQAAVATPSAPVTAPGTPAATPSSPVVTAPPARRVARLGRLPGTIRVDARGRARVAVRCLNAPGDVCVVRLVLHTRPVARAGARRARPVAVGTVRGIVPGGRRARLTVTLNAAGRRLAPARPRLTLSGVSLSRARMATGVAVAVRVVGPRTR